MALKGKTYSEIPEVVTAENSDTLAVYKSGVGLKTIKKANLLKDTYTKAEADNRFAEKLTRDITVYVATTGNDSTGDGSELKPYKTINYALSRIPKNLNGFTATVNVAEGTYKEDVRISDTIGNIHIFATNVSVNTIYINNCSYVYVKGITVLKQHERSAPVIINNSNVSIDDCIAKTTSQTNITIHRSLVDIKNTTTGNATYANIYGVWSLVSVEYSTFTGNSTNINSQSSIICIESTTIGQTRKVGGGQIFE